MGGPVAALDQVKDMLSANDDTSRFVGLALLKSILDNQVTIREDKVKLRIIWDSISPKFLDRLLRARQNKSISKDAAMDMVDIAVAVLHIFTILLPPDAQDEQRFFRKSRALVHALLESTSETTVMILQTLSTIVSQMSGALEFLRLEDITNLIEIAPEQPLVLDIFSMAWSIAATESTNILAVKANITKVLPALTIVFHETDAVTLLEFIGKTFPRLPIGAIDNMNTPWMGNLVALIRKLVINQPTKQSRSAYTLAAAALLQVNPGFIQGLMFKEYGAHTAKEIIPKGPKPFSLFIKLLLVDIRSTLPSLLSKLNSTEYSEISTRLSAAFDIVTSFIGFLIKTLDNENDEEAKKDVDMILVEPELLLKLRKELAETMSLAIEYLRDRFDASVAGASGLHPLARTGPSSTSGGKRLNLTWDSKEHSIYSDRLTFAALGALAVFVQEDENENLRNECAGLMDLLMDLYKYSSHGLLPQSQDFRPAILVALGGGILNTEAGIEAFIAQDAWKTLVEDLNLLLKRTINQENSLDNTSIQGQVVLGVEVARALNVVVDHELTTEPREEWMNVIKDVAAIRPTTFPFLPGILELEVAILQLAADLLSLAPVGMRKRYAASTAEVLRAVTQLHKEVVKLTGPFGTAINEELSDIRSTLKGLE